MNQPTKKLYLIPQDKLIEFAKRLLTNKEAFKTDKAYFIGDWLSIYGYVSKTKQYLYTYIEAQGIIIKNLKFYGIKNRNFLDLVLGELKRYFKKNAITIYLTEEEYTYIKELTNKLYGQINKIKEEFKYVKGKNYKSERNKRL